MANCNYLFGCDSGIYKCGGIAPVKATDDMTQPVGQRNGQLFTAPTGGGSGLPDVSDVDNGKVLKVVNGVWALVYPNELPPVTSADNGKILKVVNGAWAGVDPETGGISVAGRRFRGIADIELPDAYSINTNGKLKTYIDGVETDIYALSNTATRVLYTWQDSNDYAPAVLDSGLQWENDNNGRLIWFADDAPNMTETDYTYLTTLYEPLN